MPTSQELFPWTRYWSSVHSDGEAPSVQDGQFTYDDINNIACLILLGSPGSGKTTEMQRACDAEVARDRHAIFIPLRTITSRQSIEERIAILFSPEGDSEESSIFFDGLDEATVKYGDLMEWIATSLQSLKSLLPDAFGKLRVRLSCRSAVWSTEFATGLKRVWGEKEVEVFRLLPLTEADISAAATSTLGMDEAEFQIQVEEAGLTALAETPITLRMLLNLMRKENRLPKQFVTIYRDAMLSMLAQERAAPDPDDHPDPTSTRKLQVVGRMAAVCLLTNKPRIWMEQSEEPPLDAIPISEFAGGSENDLGEQFSVDLRELTQCINTALFDVKVSGIVEWRHATFAEFLAAHYLSERPYEPHYLLNLLSQQEQDQWRIVPQLSEVAAWLAGLRSDFRNLLVKNEPKLLLVSDVATADDSFKFDLVEELLHLFDKEELHYWWSDRRVNYARLCFKGLAPLLSVYIRDRSKGVIARRFAIEVAEACRQSELAADLLAVALDENDSAHLRARSIRVLSELHQQESLAALVTPLREDRVHDPNDEIRGHTLRALWPQYLNGRDLFLLLRQRKRINFLGSYSTFLRTAALGELDQAGILAGLGWIDGIDSIDRDSHTYVNLINQILSIALANIKIPTVLLTFAGALAAMAKKHSRYFNDENAQLPYLASTASLSSEDKATLILALAKEFADASRFATSLVYPLRLISPDDIRWLLPELDRTPSRFAITTLIEILSRLFAQQTPDQVAEAWDYAARHPELASTLEAIYSTQLDSPYARWAKDDWARQRREARRRKPVAPKPADQIATLLAESEKNSSAWWRLTIALLLDDTKSQSHSELDGDLSTSPGWLNASPDQKQAIVSAAYRYLISPSNLPNLDWFGTGTILRPAAAGYKALRLLYGQARPQFDSLPNEIWKTWVYPVLWFITNDGNDEAKIRGEIALRAKENSEAEFFNAVSILLQRGFESGDLIAVVEASVDDRLAAMLWDAVLQGRIGRQSSVETFEVLIDKKYQPTTDWLANTLLTKGGRSSVPDGNSDPTIFGPGTWLLKEPVAVWPLFKLRTTTDEQHAAAIWSWLAYARSRMLQHAFEKLSSENLVDAYIWTRNAFPRSSSKDEIEVTLYDHVEGTRRDILKVLVERGTDESVAALQRLVIASPESGLKWRLYDAREIRRRKAWIWPSAQQVLDWLGIAQGRSKSSRLATIAAEYRLSGDQQLKSATDATREIAQEVTVPQADDRIRPPSSIGKKLYAVAFVATEWFSEHGGISTLNRDLAIALVKFGHQVSCVVPPQSDQVKESALEANVTLAEVQQYRNFDGRELLSAFSVSPLQIEPDFIIGHDQITGKEALRLRDAFHRSAKYIHFLHTIPTETESYKGGGDTLWAKARKGNQKRDNQKNLCDVSDAMVGIGPRIAEHARSLVPGREHLVLNLLPGMDPDCLKHVMPKPESLQIRVLWLGRAEDHELKGLDIVLALAHRFDQRTFTGGRRAKFVIQGVNEESVNRIEHELSKQETGVQLRNLEFGEYSADPKRIREKIFGASCLLMPSQTEPFGLVALEGIAAGAPVMISSQSGIGELLARLEVETNGAIKVSHTNVLDVQSDIAATVDKWADTLSKILDDRATAFNHADTLRQKLTKHLDWTDASSMLSKFFDTLATA